MSSVKHVVAGTVFGLILAQTPAQAGFLGQGVTWQFASPTTNAIVFDRGSAVVGSGQEFRPQGLNDFAVDASGSQINIQSFALSPDSFQGNPFSGFRFSDAGGTIPDIVGVTLGGSTTWAGIDAASLSFDANDVFVNLSNTTANFLDQISVNVQFAGNNPNALLGQSLGWRFAAPTTNSTVIDRGTAIVGNQQEFHPQVLNDFAVDIDDSHISVQSLGLTPSSFQGSPFAGFRFSDTNGTIPDIVGVTLDPSTDWAGIDPSRLSFDADHIFLNLNDTTAEFLDQVVLDVAFAAVPESSSGLLLGAGIVALLGWARRRSWRRQRAGGIAGLAFLVALSVATNARAAEIFRSEAFSIAGSPGFASVGFQGFDPTLGTLDRVLVSISGTLQFGVTLQPGGVVKPIVDFAANGLGGSGFDFAGTGARFLFAPLVNANTGPGAAPLQAVLSENFSLDFTLNALSDLTGFAFANVNGSPAPLQPPTSVNGQRADFIGDFGVLEDLLFSPVDFVPDSGFEGGGTISVTFDFTPAAGTAAPEPPTLALLAPLVLIFIGARRRAASKR